MSDIKFEDALARLEQIVDTLESGKLPLEDSLKAVSYTHLTLPTILRV